MTGALSLIDTAGPRFLGCLDMPILRFGTKTRYAIDARAIGDWLTEATDGVGYPEAIVVEAQQPMHGKAREAGEAGFGAISTFLLGGGFIAILTALAPLGIPIHFSVPGQWKKAASLTGKQKDAALSKARQVFGIVPELSHGRGRDCTKEQAIARSDAGLVGFYGLPERVIGKRAVVSSEELFGALAP